MALSLSSFMSTRVTVASLKLLLRQRSFTRLTEKEQLPADGEEREAAEKALAKELSDYLSRALESGGGKVPVFDIAEGHCRMGVNKDEGGGYIVAWFAAKEYKTPGEVATPPEMATPVFGYKVRDAKHARLIAEGFSEIADRIEKKEGEKDGQEGA